MIRQLQKEGFLRRALTQTRPLLTEKHKTDRLKWCLLYEKWFYVKKIGQKVYLLTGHNGTPCEDAIQSLQSVTVPRTAEDLILEVEMAFASTTTTTLNKTFLSVQLIMQSIMRHNGGNAFCLSHTQKDKLLRAGELPDPLSCDPALFWATLAKVVPQSVTTYAPPPSLDLDAFF
ncbi:hypothetical protein DVH05_018279 [Phytophthora capsici]|nr:hypothetical protein DVH05_018279 [Phytophthora capsici]